MIELIIFAKKHSCLKREGTSFPSFSFRTLNIINFQQDRCGYSADIDNSRYLLIMQSTYEGKSSMGKASAFCKHFPVSLNGLLITFYDY